VYKRQFCKSCMEKIQDRVDEIEAFNRENSPFYKQ